MTPKKNVRPVTIFLLSTMLLTLMLSDALSREAAASELTILYSNDIRGETEPCG